MGRSKLLIILIVLAAVAQAAVSPLMNALHLGQDMAARSAPVTTPATPAGWAFAIWGLIYLWSLVYAVWQALPARRNDSILAETRPAVLAAFALNTVWVAWVQLQGVDLVSLAVIVAALAANLMAMTRLRGFAAAPFSRTGLTVKAPIGLLAGWITVAAFANAAAVQKAHGFDPVGLGLEQWAALLIGAAGMLAAVVTSRSRRAVFYVAAAAWGLAAVIVRNLEPDGSTATVWTAATAILVTVFVLVAGWRRKSRRSRLNPVATG